MQLDLSSMKIKEIELTKKYLTTNEKKEIAKQFNVGYRYIHSIIKGERNNLPVIIALLTKANENKSALKKQINKIKDE